MQLQKILQLKKLDESRDVIVRLMDENIETKLDVYLRKFASDDKECSITLTLDVDKKGLFLGSVQAKFDGQSLRAERTEFRKLDDLVNHLFDHRKLQLSQ